MAADEYEREMTLKAIASESKPKVINETKLQAKFGDEEEMKETEEETLFDVSDDMKMDNSRTSMKDIAVELIEQEHMFEKNELTLGGRESIMIFKSAIMSKEINLGDFEILCVLGVGSFGKVYLTKLDENQEHYAIKSIRKDVLIETDQIESTKLERDILLKCKHPFLVGMDFVFQNDLRLYFVMPFIKGGELYKHFQKERRFAEHKVKFYAVQIAHAIGYLHEQSIVHRDLKLENILVGEDGYLQIIDFGLAKMIRDNEMTSSFCGTPEYVAPEMVAQVGHDKAVDWWALGILIYEMLIGVTPFYNRNRNVMLMKIQNSKIIFPDKKKYKIGYSPEVQDIICKLLQKKPHKRLGSKNGLDEILAHPWFEDLNSDDILSKKIEPPFVPQLNDEIDTKYFNTKTDLKSLTETMIPTEK